MCYILIAFVFFFCFIMLQKNGCTQDTFLTENNELIIFPQSGNPRYLWFLYIIFISIFAFRGIDVGGDTIKYVTEFLSDTYRDREIGYVLFCDAIKIFGNSPFVYIFFTSLVSIIPFLLLLHKHSDNPTLSLLYVFCFYNLIICFETHVRQNIGTGFILLSIYLWELVSFKSKKYLLIPIIPFCYGLLCHSSLYMAAPLCLIIPFIPISKKIAYIAVTGAFILGGFFSQLIIEFFNSFYTLIDNYDIFERLYAYSGERGGLGGFGMSAFNVSNLVLYSWMIFCIYASENEKTYYFKAFVLYAVLHCVFRTSDLTFRSFFIIQLLALTYIPSKVNTQWQSKGIMCIFLLDWLQYLLRLSITPSMQNVDAHMFPYTFIFE